MLAARALAITARKPTLIRSRKKRRELMRRGEVDALFEDIAGTVFSVEPACAVRAGAIESSRALCEEHLGTAERELAKIELEENLSSPLRRGCRRTPILCHFPEGRGPRATGPRVAIKGYDARLNRERKGEDRRRAF